MGLDWKSSENGGPLGESVTINLHPLLQGGGQFVGMMSFTIEVGTAVPSSATVETRLRWLERKSKAEMTARVTLQTLDLIEASENAMSQFFADIPEYDPLNTENYLLLDFILNGTSTDGRWNLDVRLV